MNTTIVTQQLADVNAEPLINWERNPERKHKWHGKTLAQLSREDTKRLAQREQSADWTLWA